VTPARPALAPKTVAPAGPRGVGLTAPGPHTMDTTARPEGSPGRDPAATYRDRAATFGARREEQERRHRVLAYLRVIVFLASASLVVVPTWRGLPIANPLFLLGAAGFLFFGVLVRRHGRVEDRMRWFGALVSVNEEAERRVGREWAALEVPRVPEPDRDHPYARDLDLFGRASLMQLLGATGTVVGRRTMAAWLVSAVPAPQAVERQAGVAELAPLIDFRQDVTALGRLADSGKHDLDALVEWGEARPWLSERPLLLWLVRGLALSTLGLIALQWSGVAGQAWWLAPIPVGLWLSYRHREQLVRTLDRVFWRERILCHYETLFRRLAELAAEAPVLKRLQAELRATGDSAHRELVRLRRIVELADLRHVPLFHFPIHALTLWDFHVLWLLERWQIRSGRRMREWFDALGEMEALGALAELRHDNPGWAFPAFAPGARILEARGLGHPLLKDGVRVVNDVEVGPPGTCLLVTGSNMSGKSTLLKAIGVNVVLAQAGGPVCATALRMPPLALHTCIHVQDSLEEGISYFMAGLKRLRLVVEAARTADAATTGMLYLLDEVLQGTNTAERQVAVRVILRHLLALPAIGVVTTHDLTLADEEALARACKPVHFTEGVDGRAGDLTLSFDYKLRPGLATSRNALKLLRMMGLGD